MHARVRTYLCVGASGGFRRIRLCSPQVLAACGAGVMIERGVQIRLWHAVDWTAVVKSDHRQEFWYRSEPIECSVAADCMSQTQEVRMSRARPMPIQKPTRPTRLNPAACWGRGIDFSLNQAHRTSQIDRSAPVPIHGKTLGRPRESYDVHDRRTRGCGGGSRSELSEPLGRNGRSNRT